MTKLSEQAAARIRAVMAARKISVADYAKQTNQSADVVSRRINGKVDLSLTDIEAFANLTGYQPSDFLNNQFITAFLEIQHGLIDNDEVLGFIVEAA